MQLAISTVQEELALELLQDVHAIESAADFLVEGAPGLRRRFLLEQCGRDQLSPFRQRVSAGLGGRSRCAN